MILRIFLSIAAACLCLPAQSVPRSSALVFLHVTTINPGSSSVADDRAVVIRNGRITEVAGAAGYLPPDSAQVVDGTGKFLIPGLWDMHVHSAFGDWFPRGREVILPLFIANGVTGVRDMGGDLPVLLEWRKQIAAGEIPGPRMAVSGPMLDGYLPGKNRTRFPSSIPVTTPAEAVKAVDSLKAQGAEFIKVQSVLTRPIYAAAAREAHRQNLPLVGHIPDHIKITEAVTLGQKSIEHFMGVLEGCSNQEDRLLKGVEDTKLLLSSFDEVKCRKLIALLARSHTWLVPTMAWNGPGLLLDQLDMEHQPLFRYVPVFWKEVTWKRFYDQMMPEVHRDPLSVRQELLAQSIKMIGKLHQGGVEFLAGTDTAPGIFVMPGFSLHDELGTFVDAGFSPMEALATATSNPARFFERDDIGAIAQGKIADLVLLERNPLQNIWNVRGIRGVVADGRYYDQERLEAMLTSVQQAAKK